MPIVTPYVPEYIIVHLGSPQSNAQNVTITFPDYIKNVASSEIYPTWNESAIYANIYAQISFALNRVYLEHYRSRGYNFNITNSTAYDQSFVPGRNIFENIDRIVDDIFNNYIRRMGYAEPLAAKYCNGTTVQCSGLSQWGSQDLANQGYNSTNILRYYYGYNIELVKNAPISQIRSSYPGYPLSRGSVGNNVIVIQTSLNRISQNYPSIPKIPEVDGVFGPITEEAVIAFQKIFNLSNYGTVDKATWYRIVYLYTSVKRLAELDSEGQRLFGESLTYPDAISEGDSGKKVTILQYFLSILAEFYDNIPFVKITGEFGNQTKFAVVEVQKATNLPQTGVVDDVTWNEIYRQYIGIVNTVLLKRPIRRASLKAGNTTLQVGSSGEDVLKLQEYLNAISKIYKGISNVNITGKFDQNTMSVVIQYQREFGLKPTGVVDKPTFDSIESTYDDILSATNVLPTQYPGYELKVGASDNF